MGRPPRVGPTAPWLGALKRMANVKKGIRVIVGVAALLGSISAVRVGAASAPQYPGADMKPCRCEDCPNPRKCDCCPDQRLGMVSLSKSVMADGALLPAGKYDLRLSPEKVLTGRGQSAESEKYVLFIRDGKIFGREIATVVPESEIGNIVKSPAPKPGSSKVETLKGGDYLRVWVNKDGLNYLINLPKQP